MPHTRAELAAALSDLGLKAGGVVMIHASIRAVGPTFGGPDEIVRALEDALAPNGTLMMYVSCAFGFDDVGRNIMTPEEEAVVRAHQPAFDFQTARANREFGALAEFFRSTPGTICSEQVCARMAARGARAAWLTADAPLNYGFGKASPLAKLCEADGHVLLLGSNHDEVTLLHHAEHIADFPDKRIARYVVPLIQNGRRTWVPCEEVETADRAHDSWPDNFFELIVDNFIAHHDGTHACRRGKVGGADAVLMRATALVDHAVLIMVRQARDPHAVPESGS
jgi:aminoglycoside 3-N-acetyltransferase